MSLEVSLVLTSAALLAVTLELGIPAMLASFAVGGRIGLAAYEGDEALFRSKKGKPSLASREFIKKVAGNFFTTYSKRWDL